MVLQAFWRDYFNGNYRYKWADYLSDLAPRLKSMGIDAVWLPPTPKNKNATNDVGYSPFDPYDLGDKYQKGNVRTRFGTKDELLRLVAVLHANGIEVIQDVVLNHTDGAGTAANGAGGQNPELNFSLASNNGYKAFRYSLFATHLPETGDYGAAYAARQGRWPKNYANFHPQPGHNTTIGDMADPLFGPDFCYGNDGGSDGYGPLSPAYLAQYPGAFNPAQGAGYNQNQARNWIAWLKKQTGTDGFRWDAVKHFSYNTQQDLSYNLKYNAGWASGGEGILNEAEYGGTRAQEDGYVSSLTGQNGGTDVLMGVLDFNLRQALYGLVTGNGILAAHDLTVESGATLDLAASTTFQVSGNLTVAGALTDSGTLGLNGSTEQTVSTGRSAALALSGLALNSAANARLLSPVTVADALIFSAGHLIIDNQNLTLSGNATVTGADANSYVITPDVAASGGRVVRPVPTGGAPVSFPVGTAASYTPLTLANSGASTTFQVRTFNGLLTSGTSGAPYVRQSEFVNRTWEVLPALAAGPVVTMSVEFNAADQNPGFVPGLVSLFRNPGGAGAAWTELGRATLTGNGPYVATYAGVSSFLNFALGKRSGVLAVAPNRLEAGRYYVTPNPGRGETLQLLGGAIRADNGPVRLSLSNVLGSILLAPNPAPRATLAEQLSTALRHGAPGAYLLTITGPNGLLQRLRVVRE